MGFLDKNIIAIKERHQKLYDKLHDYTKNSSGDTNDGLVVESMPAKDRNKALYVTRDGQSVRLNSSYYPVSEALIWSQQYNFDRVLVILTMFGLGNGIFAREVIRNLGQNYVFILYEPSKEIFYHVIHNFDVSDLLGNPNVTVIVEGLNDLDYDAVLNNNVNWSNINSLQELYHPQYDRLYPQSIRYFKDKLVSHRTVQVVQQNTAAYFGVQIAQNTVRNLQFIPFADCSVDYKDLFPSELPAIIVGAGPSLDKNIEELKNAKGKSVIFATDTSLKYLMAHDILPDYVITMDSKKWLGHFTDDRCKTIPMLCSIESNTILLKYHTGKKIFYNTGRYLNKYYENLGKKQIEYSSGGSVSTACFSLCANLGFQKIVLIGQDLAYGGDATHAGGVVKNVNHTGEKTLMVEDIYGNMIKTRYDWYSYILWYNNAIAICKENGIEVIDATEGGAKLDGARIMSLSEVITQFCRQEVDIPYIESTIVREPVKEKMSSLHDYIIQSVQELDTISEYASYAIEICRKLIRAAERNQLEQYKNQTLVKKISQLNNSIQEKPVYCLIDDFILSVTTSQLDGMNSLSRDEDSSKLDVYRKSILIYQAVKDAVIELKSEFVFAEAMVR